MVLDRLVEALPLGLREDAVELAEQARDAGREAVDAGAHVDRRRQVAQEPLGAARQRLARLIEQDDLLVGGDPAGQQLDLAEQRHQREGVAGDDVGARDRVGRAPGMLAELAHELAQAAVDQAVGDQRRDDLAAQAVAR